jgi:hypothetical protein
LVYRRSSSVCNYFLQWVIIDELKLNNYTLRSSIDQRFQLGLLVLCIDL